MACEMMEAPAARTEIDNDDVILSRDAILTANDLVMEAVKVPEWGGIVFVRCMTGRERDSFEAAIDGGKGNKTSLVDFRARFASAVVCDQEGKRLFSVNDIEALSQKSGAALDRIFDTGKRVNRIGEDEERELIANFSGAPAEDSGSD